MNYDYEFFVIGAGSGGVRAARRAGAMGVKTAVAESRFMGGTCVNVGCVPKKLFWYASHYREEIDLAKGYGWTSPPGSLSFHWPTLVANKDKEIARLNGIYEKLLNDAHVEIINGRATFIDEHTLDIDGRRLTAERILIATGGHPSVPKIPGVEHAIISDDCFYLNELPERIIIVGGGYIAVEFANIFHNLGVKVTQLYRSDLFLRGFDMNARQLLADTMQNKGIDVRFNKNIASIEKNGSALAATLESGETLEADQIMYATGRAPNTSEIGLENTTVETKPNGAITVDAYSRATVEHIFAVGDCTDRMNLTPVAIAEAEALVKTLFARNPTSMDYANIAHAVFSQPPLASCGMTEEKAAEVYGTVDVYFSTFRPMKFILPQHEERAMMKLIVDAQTDRVVGAHFLGPDAPEMMQAVAVAMHCGATKAQFDATIGIHPTSAEEFVTLRSKKTIGQA